MEIIVENNKNKFYNPKYDKESNKSKNKKTQKFRPIKDLSNPDKLLYWTILSGLNFYSI